MTRKKMAVIGCGKMATALISGVSKDDLEFFGYNPTQKKAGDLMEKVGGTAVAKLDELPHCDFYLIGAKPQHFKELSNNFSPPKESTVISLMAGVSLDSLKLGFKTDKVIRLMPNTPCLIGLGVIGLIATKEVQDLSYVSEIFKTVGLVQVVEKEEDINIITAFTGSGPAYIFELANILSNLMQDKGFTADVSQRLIEKMILGSATLMAISPEGPAELRDNVTSKGGTTEAALKVFKELGLRDIVNSAITANLTRASKLEGENK
jgi:pyrroline-5-carboxylate reductase